MPPTIAWYLLVPVLAVTMLGGLAAVLRWRVEREDDPLADWYSDGLVLFAEPEDFGLLSPAALAEDADVAQDVRRLLAAAGIRSTVAATARGQVRVLVFAEDVEVARRLVGGSPGRPYPED